MRADQVMTHRVVTVAADTSIAHAADLMLRHHISGLPVIDQSGKLVGIVSEGDFLRRSEIGTQTKRNRLLSLIVGPGKEADEFVRQAGRKVGEVMTVTPTTISEETTLEQIVRLMEKNNIKRLPVLNKGKLTGIVTRSDLLRAVARVYPIKSVARVEDDKLRDRIIQAIRKNDWAPISFGITVHDGVIHIDGTITDERSRQATIVAVENVAGVNQVHDHLCWVDPMSGLSVVSPEDANERTPRAS